MSADIFIYILPYLTSRLLIIAPIIGGEPQAGSYQSEFRRFFFSLHKFLFSFFSVTQSGLHHIPGTYLHIKKCNHCNHIFEYIETKRS